MPILHCSGNGIGSNLSVQCLLINMLLYLIQALIKPTCINLVVQSNVLTQNSIFHLFYCLLKALYLILFPSELFSLTI